MATLKRLLHRLAAFVRHERAEQDLAREVEAHIALLEDDFQRRGMTLAQARVAARRAIGGLDQTKEQHRDARSFLWLEDLRRDVPYAWRGLARDPGFTAAAVLTLALGIGATTAIFSVVNTVLLQPLPYKDSDQLVRIVEYAPARNAGSPPLRRTSMTWAEFVDWRARTTTLSAMTYYVMPPITLMPMPSGSARLTGALVSANTFEVLGARALLGRTLESRDEAAGSNVVVISSSFWNRSFQADPNIIGRTIPLKTLGPEAGFLDGTPLTIVGVMPASFDFPVAQTDFWAPVSNGSPAQSRLFGGVTAVLKEGVSLQAAVDEANIIGDALRPKPTSGPMAQPLPPGVRRFGLLGVKEQLVAPIRPALRVLAIAVGAVLLIVCANIANLLLARGSARQREIAVRLAIGASRGRVVRQVLTESAVLAVTGGLLGALLAIGGVHLVRSFATPDAQGVFQIVFSNSVVLPRLHEITIDARVLGLSLALAGITALLFGITPALKLARVDHLQAMGYRGAGGALRGDTRLRSLLVVGQLTMATVLLVAAGLLINSFTKLSRVDPGWDPEGVLTFYLVMPQDYSTARKATVIEDLLAELRRTPGVERAGYTYAGPLLGLVDQYGVFVPPGRTPEEMKGNPDNPQIRSVSYDFFQTMRVKLVAGRLFDERDSGNAPPVLVVNRSVVQRLFGNHNPVGRLVHLDGRMEFAPQQIVGVIEDMKQGRLDQDPLPQMFMDYRQILALTQQRQEPVATQERLAFGFLSFAVRTSADPVTLIQPVRSAVNRVDPGAGIDAIMPMEQLVATSLTRQRFYALLLGVFAFIALALGAIGIYGVLAYAVLQRTQEIGIRMALGARRREVLGLVLRRGAVLTTIGITLGIVGAASAARYLTGMLYGLTPLDPTTYFVVALLFALVALLASYLPARRATKVDPMVALRCE